ncbi:Polyprenyl synthetase [Popillia japonica]|uniref:Polyprenyl synthetase n=1 Tax=Popillia japonica TaxID=7064 RepID=A0AAW1K2R6_POPJA
MNGDVFAFIEGYGLIFQSSLEISDDVIDSYERRQTPKNEEEEIGVKAINDSMLVENGLYSILRKHFSGRPCYLPPCYLPALELFHDATLKSAMGQTLEFFFSGRPCYLPALELFHDATLKSAMGQTLEFFANKDGQPDLTAFTMSRYNAIVKYSTSYYSFYLPVALAMYLSSRFDPEMHRQARTILMEMGHFYQVQEDFLDCFGDPANSRKTSWIVSAIRP